MALMVSNSKCSSGCRRVEQHDGASGGRRRRPWRTKGHCRSRRTRGCENLLRGRACAKNQEEWRRVHHLPPASGFSVPRRARGRAGPAHFELHGVGWFADAFGRRLAQTDLRAGGRRQSIDARRARRAGGSATPGRLMPRDVSICSLLRPEGTPRPRGRRGAPTRRPGRFLQLSSRPPG